MDNDYVRIAKSIVAHCGGKQAIHNKVERADFDSDGCAILDILVDGHHGQYMPQVFCNRFEVDGCDNIADENYWHNWTHIDSNLCEEVNNLLQTENYVFFLANSDSDGDYCLFVGDNRA